MSNPLVVVDKIVEYFVGKVCQSVGRHVGFLFHYKRNVKNLKDEKNNLQQQRSNVQEKVDQAEHHGEAIDNKVSDWLQEADKASQGVDTFMDVKAVKENMHCFNFSCPDYISHYRLSKQAEKKAVSIKQLAEKGVEIGIVSHPREDPPELEIPSSVDYEDFHSRQKVFKGIAEALKDSNVNMIGVYGTGGVVSPPSLQVPKMEFQSKKKCKAEKEKDEEEEEEEREGNGTCHSLRDIAWAVCKECQGLSVAIYALGAALKNANDMHAWKDALHKLKNSKIKDIEGIDPKVYASLKWSYDRLQSEDAKSCFLLCCLFAEDAEISIDDLVRHYMAGRTSGRSQILDTLEQALDRVSTVVHTLKSCCLLLDVRHKHVVKMHDVVRDVAISIAEDEKSFLVKHGVRYWPEKDSYKHCSVISLMPQEMGEFPNELVCLNLHTLRLDCSANNKLPLQVPDMFFSGTENLLALDLNGVPMLPLPASLAKLAKLHMLCLNKCKLGDIAILKDLKDHLEILSLRGSDIEVLPEEVGELTLLRLLDMTNCDSLEMIQRGVISKLVLLEELYMPMTFNQWEGTSVEREISNVSLDELMSLIHLTTLHICIKDPALLPKWFTFENLARFIIVVGTTSHGWSFGGILRLRNFHIENALEFLLGNPKRKRSIGGNGFYPSTSFNHLSRLSVINCRLKSLFSPSCARLLVQLESLVIRRCSIMEVVIGTEGENDEDIVFRRLKILHLEYLENLISFYPKKLNTTTSSGSSSTHAQMALFNDKATFPALEELEIVSVPEITEIWNKQIFPIPETATKSFCCQLSEMTIRDCGKLINVIGGCPKIEAIEMESLTLDSCPMVEVVVDLEKKEEITQDAANNTIVPFPKLSFLSLTRLQKIKGFCAFRSEEHHVFNTQVTFPKLEHLVVDTFGEIALTNASELSLKRLVCYECDEVSTVVSPHLLRRLRFVDLLDVRRRRGAREVFHFDGLEVGEGQVCVGQLTQVRKFYLDDLPQLTSLWNKDPHRLLGLQSLEYLTIKHCPLLANLFAASIAKALGGLKVFYLSSCSTMEAVIATDEGHRDVLDDDREIVFPKLEWLILKDLSNLKSFCTSNHNFNFPSLKRLVLKRCPKVQAFTSGSVRTPQILLSTRGNECLQIKDLNKHLEQQHLKGDQETILDHEMEGDEDRFSNWRNLENY
ncbi:hypothetical protein Vadar_009699 [Vaccinium darrowii]|uniref:Uncharacterized protein n=1 Tax=Vaccinium darrowii TaxID=229202 RepID=A0ACB7XPG5_9ERIC|nr:hypothetical protein Vadar_009699 [Vaccinium darrowii]